MWVWRLSSGASTTCISLCQEHQGSCCPAHPTTEAPRQTADKSQSRTSETGLDDTGFMTHNQSEFLCDRGADRHGIGASKVGVKWKDLLHISYMGGDIKRFWAQKVFFFLIPEKFPVFLMAFFHSLLPSFMDRGRGVAVRAFLFLCSFVSDQSHHRHRKEGSFISTNHMLSTSPSLAV